MKPNRTENCRDREKKLRKDKILPPSCLLFNGSMQTGKKNNYCNPIQSKFLIKMMAANLSCRNNTLN